VIFNKLFIRMRFEFVLDQMVDLCFLRVQK
jgi:hypothetical protein